MNYSKAVPNTKTKRAVTPQSKPIPMKESIMTANSAGGYSFALDNWSKLNRFLILGTEGGTYYISEKSLTKQNVDNTIACIKENPKRVLDTIVDISVNNRAPKNDQAVFVLALLFVHGDAEVKSEASKVLPEICRTGTHLFMFTYYVSEMRSLGRSIRKAISNWYSMDIKKLEYQVAKYQGRQVEGTNNKWTHKDVIRMAHVKPVGAMHNNLFHYFKTDELGKDFKMLDAIQRLNSEKDVAKAVKLIGDFKLTHEMIPTELKNEIKVWDALLPNMPLHAMIRNLNKMTSIGLLTGTSTHKATVIKNLTDADYLKASRVHPMAVLNAMKVYSEGHGMKGSLSWKPVQQIVDALDSAFYLSFGNVEPTGKSICVALDVSGSMGCQMPGSVLTCREASAAMALITMNAETNYEVVGFTSGGVVTYKTTNGRSGWGGDGGLTELRISPKQRLDDVVRYISGLSFGGTDCALPVLWAEQTKRKLDAFVIYTDNETWAGDIHPSQALKKYRKTVPEAKMAVVGMATNGFSIADPTDKGMMDFVGFSNDTPQIISSFIKGDF